MRNPAAEAEEERKPKGIPDRIKTEIQGKREENPDRKIMPKERIAEKTGQKTGEKITQRIRTAARLRRSLNSRKTESLRERIKNLRADRRISTEGTGRITGPGRAGRAILPRAQASRKGIVQL